MCTVINLALAAMAVVSTGSAVIMQEEAAANQRRMARYQASMAEAQAKTASYEAANARKLAKYDAQNLRREFLRAQGSQRSLLAAGGVGMADGSSMDVLLDNASQARRQEELRLYQGEMDAWRAENQSRSLLADAGMAKMKASQSKVSGWTYAQTAVSFANQQVGAYAG
ncbi:hypothetical protein N1030_17580 [Desulfovibrio mangrovi]|uniref:hypothetical protein n=1 Tax=Desulfovibrio mangrovi TaxID=2976983 RepID=UPI002246B8B3|nr:hypothetical protein [Desulfovibrio mangrovi]UZP67384.1 hypothetical protein N1030_17580 [Desulfovibrio mangrovi]